MMDDWLLGLESFALFGHQLGAQKPIDSERASKPACLPASRAQATNRPHRRACKTDRRERQGQGVLGFWKT